jgi:hypothetical protein
LILWSITNFDAGFIIPGTIGAVIMWLFFPDTLGKPLEETAALFGDAGMCKSLSAIE